MSTRSLRSQLVFGVVIVITTFVAVQLCIRAFVTYPQLKALSEKHDFYELQRVASEVQQELRALENLVYDNAVWDSTYNAIATKDVNWLAKTYFLPTSYTTLGIDGWLFFDKQNNVVAAEVFQSTLTLDEISQAATTSGIFDAVEQPSTVRTVFSMFRDTPAALIASKILPSDEQGESNGTAVVLQRVDQGFIERITPNITGDITFHAIDTLTPQAISQSISFNALNLNGTSTPTSSATLPRLYVRFESQQGHTLFAISIARPKGPDKHVIVDGSLLGGALVSVLSLIVFYGFINRKLIDPVYELLSLVQRAQDEQDFSLRCKPDGDNEVHQLGTRLNNLLSLIEKQQNVVYEKNQILEGLSRTDALTGLSNRRYFDEWLATLADSSSTTNNALSLLVIDIDYFKLFNDYYGHAKGDEALKLVASSIKQSLHEATDHAFRFGGEEFTVILQNTNLKDAKTVADNIRKHVENINYAHDKSPISNYITISIGVAAKAPGEQLNESELFADADRALYQAKAKGRNTVCSV